MDLWSPSIKDIVDFLLFLFEEKGLQPSTIEVYRSALADKLGNEPLQISKNEDLTRLLDSFHIGTDPKEVEVSPLGICRWSYIS